jgi:hypothetical protein
VSETIRLGKQNRTQRAPATREGGWDQWALLRVPRSGGFDLSSSGLERQVR